MKIIKFIVVTGLIVALTSIIPMFLLNQALTLPIVNVEGVGFGGAAGYLTKITSDSNATREIKENAVSMLEVYQDSIKYKNDTFGRYSTYLFVISGIILIVFGITLSKFTDKKFIASCLITAGIITLCFCGYAFLQIMALN